MAVQLEAARQSAIRMHFAMVIIPQKQSLADVSYRS
jgi:hypothetical protein